MCKYANVLMLGPALLMVADFRRRLCVLPAAVYFSCASVTQYHWVLLMLPVYRFGRYKL
jgi:hypothetical protein